VASTPMGQTTASFDGQGLVCSPEAAVSCNDAGACLPAVPGPFMPCLAQSGHAYCPAGLFGVAHYVGTGAKLGCSDCSCTVKSTCTAETVTYYRDSFCQNSALATTADGTCVRAGGGSTAYLSYIFSATVGNVTCTAISTPTVGLADEETLCCPQ
jgi:hypothetical protein